MGRRLRYLPYPGCLVDITGYVFQGRKLLRPDPEVTDIILGILGKGLQKFPDVNLINYNFMSTHEHMLAAPTTLEVLASFMAFIQANISKDVGTRLRDWPGAFWHGPYAAFPVLDEARQVERLRHLFENSVKEDLVERIEDWPGATGVRTALTGVPAIGTWYDRTLEYELNRRKNPVSNPCELVAEKVEVPLEPLPCWKHLSQQEQAQRVQTMLDDIYEENAIRRKKEGKTVFGVENVLAADPYERQGDGRPPRKNDDEQSEQPICFASTPALRESFRDLYNTVLLIYHEASKAFRAGESNVDFPDGTFRPSGGFNNWTDESAPSSLEWIERLAPD